MIVLHCAGDSTGLRLWAEKTPDSTVKPSPRRGRRSQSPPLCQHPYDAGREGLKTALSSFDSGVKISKRNISTVCVWLPSQGRLPRASSGLIADPPDNRRKLELLPWEVMSRLLSHNEACALLGACVGKATLARGVLAGEDTLWFAAALRLAGALVVRECFLPTLRRSENGFEARWQPVFDADDSRRVAELVARMPASCRCLSAKDAETPPDTAARTLADNFIADAVDRFVREAGQGTTEKPKRRRGKRASFDSVHDAWLHALRSPDALIPWEDEAELTELMRRIREWRRPMDLSTHAEYRLCFRLEEPKSPPKPVGDFMAVPVGDWRVRFLVHPKEDRSLLVELGDVWEPAGRKSELLQKYGGNVREYLLAALGQAAGLCPDVARSLEKKNPRGHPLDTAGAHRFLTSHAPALEAAGFGVLLPAWWTRRGTKQRISVRAAVKSPKIQAGGGLSLSALVDFNWELALGGKKLPIDDLLALAELKAPLVKVRGEWVELDASQIHAAADFWRKQQPGQVPVGQVLRMALGATSAVEDLPFHGVRATGWVNDLLKRLEGKKKLEQLTAPEGFSGTLRPYQVRGCSWLAFLRQWGLGACLADDMGLGKTIQALALIERERAKGESRPVLLVCPTSLVNNWSKEAERFTPQLAVMVHHGSDRRKREAFKEAAAAHDMVVSSYGLLQRDVDFLKDVEWAGVILDEAQNVKNPETKQSRAARSLSADYRIALTGTPVENHVGDLWAIMEFLNPGLLGTQSAFKTNFFKPVQIQRDPQAAARLKRLTGPFILRRLKTDKSIISDLPEKMEMKTFCTLTREQASLYAAVLKEVETSLHEAEGIHRKGVILATLSKLKQVCNHPAHFLGDNSPVENRSGKVARLVEMLDEIIESNERALVFSQFAEMGKILQRHLQEVFGREVLFLHGGVARKKRDRMIGRFQDDDHGPPIFILSLKAGGTGLNLTRANHVFHFDRWWNPAVENQATDRVFRIGQTRNVQVRKFICAGTIEEHIDEMIERKTAVADEVIGAGEAWLTELSNDQLKEIFALKKEAVGD